MTALERRNTARTIVPIASAFALASTLAFSAFMFGPGCGFRCGNDFDCKTGAYCTPAGLCQIDCFTDLDCQRPPTCDVDGGACIPLGNLCSSHGHCMGAPPLGDGGIVIPPPPGPAKTLGWTDATGADDPFIIDRLVIATRDQALDINGDGMSDNELAPVGPLANDQIHQGLSSGVPRIIVEIAGLARPFSGYTDSDSNVTIKLYGAIDADDPPLPQNDFMMAPGSADPCCRFKIDPRSLDTMGQPLARATAKIVRGRIIQLVPVTFRFTFTGGTVPTDITLEQASLQANVDLDLKAISNGVISGAVPVSSLSSVQNPYCAVVGPQCPIRLVSGTVVDLLTTVLNAQPDIDLDDPLDGLDCLADTNGDGRVDRCCKGGTGTMCVDDKGRCLGTEVLPLDPNGSCASNPKMSDGYSLGILFSAVHATIVGR
jgi:hypothetical protein